MPAIGYERAVSTTKGKSVNKSYNLSTRIRNLWLVFLCIFRQNFTLAESEKGNEELAIVMNKGKGQGTRGDSESCSLWGSPGWIGNQ